MAVWRNRVLNQQIVVVGALLAAGPGLRAGRIRHLQDFETGQGEAINLDNVLDYDSGTDASGQRNPENPVPSFVRVGPLFATDGDSP